MSLIFFDSVLALPPVGLKVTLAVTFILPFCFSFLAALPFAFTFSFVVPALTAFRETFVLWIGTIPLPDSVSVPALFTVTGSFAVPFFLFSFTFPKLKGLGGGGFPVKVAVTTWSDPIVT